VPSLVLVVPGSIETRTGGYGYDRRIVAGLRAAGWDVQVAEVDESFPAPTQAALDHAARTLAEIPDGRAVMIDGLALGAMPDEVEREQARLRVLALVHHPLARETGIPADRVASLEASERRALGAVRRVVVTSQATARTVASDYGVPPERLAVVEPGTDRVALARGSQSDGVHLLSVASIVPRKGHEVLIGALARLGNDSKWRLTCAGSLDRDPAAAARLHASVREKGLEDRVFLAGELGGPSLAAAYDSADVFVLPTFYEGYGMAVAEALAYGLPVVSTSTGGIAEMVKAAGILVPPGDEVALAAALSRVVASRTLRKELAGEARAMRERLADWDDASRRMAEVVSVEFQR
jgi:glycosyltransferase involved in cell wall biosynthesis